MQFSLAMTIMVGLLIIGFKNVSKGNGIHGMEKGEAIFGFVMDIAVFGIIGLRKEHGGILPGIILSGPVDENT